MADLGILVFGNQIEIDPSFTALLSTVLNRGKILREAYCANSIIATIKTPHKNSSVPFLAESFDVRMPYGIKRVLENEEFGVTVNYDSIGRSNIVRPQIVRKPEGLFDVRTEPLFVECLVN